MSIDTIKLEILNASYWEHYKLAQDLARYLPLNHPKRIMLEKELNKIIESREKLTKNDSENT